MSSSITTFLAIDPGYDRCGWAVFPLGPQSEAIEYGCIETLKTDSFFDRVNNIATQLQDIITHHHTEELAIETLFFAKNQKTALRVAELRGAITLLCLQHQMCIFEYRPIEVKQSATGNGRADKKAVEKMVRLQLNIPITEVLLDDTIDALAVGMTHQTQRKLRLLG